MRLVRRGRWATKRGEKRARRGEGKDYERPRRRRSRRRRKGCASCFLRNRHVSLPPPSLIHSQFSISYAGSLFFFFFFFFFFYSRNYISLSREMLCSRSIICYSLTENNETWMKFTLMLCLWIFVCTDKFVAHLDDWSNENINEWTSNDFSLSICKQTRCIWNAKAQEVSSMLCKAPAALLGYKIWIWKLHVILRIRRTI